MKSNPYDHLAASHPNLAQKVPRGPLGLAGVFLIACVLSGCARPNIDPGLQKLSQPDALASQTDPVTEFDHVLTTGNGFGFLTLDSQTGHPRQFLDHPYKFVAPTLIQGRREGVERRNILAKFWLAPSHEESAFAIKPQKANYLDQGPIIELQYQQPVLWQKRFAMPYLFHGNTAIAQLTSAQPLTGQVNFAFNLSHYKQLGNPTIKPADKPAIKPADKPAIKPADFAFSQSFNSTPDRQVLVLIQEHPPILKQTGPGPGAVYIELPDLETSIECRADQTPTFLKLNQPCSAQAIEIRATWSKPTRLAEVAMLYTEPDGTQSDQYNIWRTWRSAQAASAPGAWLTQERKEWETWRKQPRAKFQNQDELANWRQSETVLRLSQIREPRTPERFNTGMILASLPEGEWHIGWVRDMSYSIVALSRAGHFSEAKKALDFILNNPRVGLYGDYIGNGDYRVSITRYFGDGSEEGDFSGEPSPNIETDGWGLMLWAARVYLNESHDYAWLRSMTHQGSVYESLLHGVAKQVEKYLEPETFIMRPDTSIWERHWHARKHFTFTSIAAARGLCDFAWIAQVARDRASARHFTQLSEKMTKGLQTEFVPNDAGYLVGAKERSSETDIDGSVIEAFNFLTLPNELLHNTLEALEKLRVSSGGFKRNFGGATYDANEWLWVDLRWASALYHSPQKLALSVTAANQLLATITKAAALHHNIIPELYNSTPTDGPIGAYTGAIPMVGYGAGVYMMTLMDRSHRFESAHCSEQASRGELTF